MRSQRDFVEVVRCAECTNTDGVWPPTAVLLDSNQCLTISNAQQKKQGAIIAMRTAGCELKLFGRQGEAVAPSADRLK